MKTLSQSTVSLSNMESEDRTFSEQKYPHLPGPILAAVRHFDIQDDSRQIQVADRIKGMLRNSFSLIEKNLQASFRAEFLKLLLDVNLDEILMSNLIELALFRDLSIAKSDVKDAKLVEEINKAVADELKEILEELYE
ncbi:MAG: hypothetical protein P1V18_00340 [Candidatus Gracilibacteria bacterium]|nr:hypothetical protein [Candidatus Gracilibacteria bacterium]